MIIHKLSNNIILSILLKNNFTIYGKFIRELIELSDIPIREYFFNKNPKKIIKCIGKYVFKSILERDLNRYIDTTYINHTRLHYVSSSYLIKISPKYEFILDIIYIKNFSIELLLKFYPKILNIIIDVDSLYINRDTLGFLDIYNTYNRYHTPLLYLINNIKSKKFKIICNWNNLNIDKLNYINDLKKNNWYNCNYKLLHYNNFTDKNIIENLCGLCQEKLNETSIQLPCSHYFHYDCFYKYITFLIKNNKNRIKPLKCPYCTNTLSIKNIL